MSQKSVGKGWQVGNPAQLELKGVLWHKNKKNRGDRDGGGNYNSFALLAEKIVRLLMNFCCRLFF